MGLTLGLIGAGGSILTVPILVYMLGVSPIIATGYSLLVVGIASFVGAIKYWKSRLVDFKAAITFAIPAMLSVLIVRAYVFPAIPIEIIGIHKDIFIMLFFSVLMILASVFMLTPIKATDKILENSEEKINISQILKLVIGSSFVGFLTGMVGAGGGFLIIPTLIWLFKLDIKTAIGTSLTIIAINSLIGFSGDLANNIPLDWNLLIIFISLTLLGMIIGTNLGKKINGQHLKKLFGIFTLILGLSILTIELLTIYK